MFASRQIPHVEELTVTTRDLVPSDVAKDVLVFDWWFATKIAFDGTRRKSASLLWDVGAAELAVIDHNQAFDRGFDAARFLRNCTFCAVLEPGVFSDRGSAMDMVV